MPETPPSGEGKTLRQAYNIASDLGSGPNIRLKDNLYQAAAILVCLLIGLGLGLLFADDRLAGLLIGGLVGLVVGLFGSGVFLMVFRMVMELLSDVVDGRMIRRRPSA